MLLSTSNKRMGIETRSVLLKMKQIKHNRVKEARHQDTSPEFVNKLSHLFFYKNSTNYVFCFKHQASREVNIFLYNFH